MSGDTISQMAEVYRLARNGVLPIDAATKTVDRLSVGIRTSERSRRKQIKRLATQVENLCRLQENAYLGFVYFVDGGVGLIKIGYSSSPEDRLRSLQACSPVQLSFLSVVEGNQSDEAALHKLLSGCRRHGEWFSDTQEVRNAMAEITKSRKPWRPNSVS